ncbi:MAG TPA: hypothetical protein VGQ99_16360 [Tepidisphaeraceae bacterium]|jgi:hypothetical protein|nr:hypothetical protein [Tepidisphaeraceae bacterium]
MPMNAKVLEEFAWQPQPRAQQLIHELLAQFLSRSPQTARLGERMRDETGTRLVDWIDHFAFPHSPELEQQLNEAGFIQISLPGAGQCFIQEQGIFPVINLTDGGPLRAAIKVESVADFLVIWQQCAHEAIEGPPLAPLRMAKIFHDDEAELSAIERHGHAGFDVPPWTDHQSATVLRHQEAFRRRNRSFPEDEAGFAWAHRLVDAAIAEIGVDRACDLFFAAEREYWQRRNRAAQVQKARQECLGLGWANHDHHTYRCSRRHFAALVRLWEKLGFAIRERFYAGREAGWGAQVMEQPTTKIITFNDVDLAPDELFNDFAHQSLPERRDLGTVGLWCALHGESFLQAGMHHLEAQFDFEAVRDQLEREAGVRTMKPFTDFPHLRQAFTEGERWDVSEDRIAALLKKGQITEAQARQFRQEGAIGSHLENLERNDGFKGFNQKGVSEIISATDPRRHLGAATGA